MQSSHDLIDKSMEVFIDDVVVKLKSFEQYLVELEQTMNIMRMHNLKMNHAKCIFGVLEGNFLGFLVQNQGLK